ncbi:MAG: hypothetical protein AAF192_21590 [Pseudomonadota bacterium]
MIAKSTGDWAGSSNAPSAIARPGGGADPRKGRTSPMKGCPTV